MGKSDLATVVMVLEMPKSANAERMKKITRAKQVTMAVIQRTTVGRLFWARYWTPWMLVVLPKVARSAPTPAKADWAQCCQFV